MTEQNLTPESAEQREMDIMTTPCDYPPQARTPEVPGYEEAPADPKPGHDEPLAETADHDELAEDRREEGDSGEYGVDTVEEKKAQAERIYSRPGNTYDE